MRRGRAAATARSGTWQADRRRARPGEHRAVTCHVVTKPALVGDRPPSQVTAGRLIPRTVSLLRDYLAAEQSGYAVGMATTAPERTAADLSFLLSHASHVLATRMTAALAEIGMTPRGHCVLVHAMERELTQIELAKLSDLDKTTMVVTLDELEAAGYAERRPSRTDRRARIVAVTEAGERIAAAGRDIVDRVHRDVLEALRPAERAAFTGALTRLVGGHLATPVESARPVRRAR